MLAFVKTHYLYSKIENWGKKFFFWRKKNSQTLLRIHGRERERDTTYWPNLHWGKNLFSPFWGTISTLKLMRMRNLQLQRCSKKEYFVKKKENLWQFFKGDSRLVNERQVVKQLFQFYSTSIGGPQMIILWHNPGA